MKQPHKPRVKFAQGAETRFSQLLKERVEAYFTYEAKTRKANANMIAKICIVFFLFLTSYIAILSNALNEAEEIFCLLVFALSTFWIAVSIAHDASHGALFQNQKLNHLFAYSFNLIGVNSYIWDIKHNISHHAFTNIAGYDMDIEQIKIARLIESAPLKWYHKYQHIYVLLLYPFASLYMIFIKDFQMFANVHFGNKIYEKHPGREHLILWGSKLFYILYSIVLPILIINRPATEILTGFIFMHLIIGSLVSIVFFSNHARDDSQFPLPDSDGKIEKNWFRHQIETSTNFGVNNPVMTWFTGALNIHIPHHLFPGICHIHYPAINKIIKTTACEFGIVYREETLFNTLRAHLRFLKIMGRPKQEVSFI